MPRPLTRRPLVIKLRNLVKLVVGEQPKVEKRRGESRVYVARGQLNERRKREGHLLDLLVELLVASCPSCAKAPHGTVVALAVAVPGHVGGWWRVVVAALVHAEVVHFAVGDRGVVSLNLIFAVDRLVILCRSLSSGVYCAQSQMCCFYFSSKVR